MQNELLLLKQKYETQIQNLQSQVNSLAHTLSEISPTSKYIRSETTTSTPGVDVEYFEQQLHYSQPSRVNGQLQLNKDKCKIGFRFQLRFKVVKSTPHLDKMTIALKQPGIIFDPDWKLLFPLGALHVFDRAREFKTIILINAENTRIDFSPTNDYTILITFPVNKKLIQFYQFYLDIRWQFDQFPSESKKARDVSCSRQPCFGSDYICLPNTSGSKCLCATSPFCGIAGFTITATKPCSS